MSTSSVKAIPAGTHTVSPHLVVAGAAAAIEFYTKAFGATEILRIPTPDGKLLHASVKIGDSCVMLVDEMPNWKCLGPLALGGSPVTLHLSVEDVDAFVAKAVAAGATLKMPVADMFWGDRYGMVTDPFGHNWSVATQTKDLTPEEITAAAKDACGGGCP